MRRQLFSEEFDSIFNGVTGSWKDRPEIVALDDYSRLLEPIKKAVKEPGASANDLHGVSFLGKVYVIRPMMKNRADVDRVLFHETFDHYDLDKLIGEELEARLNRIYLWIGCSTELAKLVQRHGRDIIEYAKDSKSIAVQKHLVLMIEERSEAEEYWEKSGKGYVNVKRDSKTSWYGFKSA